MKNEKLEKEPSFIKFANSPHVPLVVDKFTDALLKAKGLPRDEGTHARLISLLTSIIENQRIEDGADLRFFLSSYDTLSVPNFTFENGKVVKPTGGRLVDPSTLTIMSFVEFLASQKLKKLKRCPYCQKFFIAKDTKRKICYDNQCFKDYKRLQKQKQREVDPVAYL